MKSNHDQEENVMRSSSRVFDSCGDYLPMWRTMSAISFVIAVSVDPLFLYIPVLEESKKCLGMDRKLKMIAVVLRSIVDLTYVTHIVFMIRSAFLPEISTSPKRIGLQRTSYYSCYWGRARMIRWWDVIIDFLAILPFPQVLILNYFTKVRSLRSLVTSKVINFFVLAQYVPRILRVYISCQNLKTTPGLPHNKIIRFGAILNVVLYIVASHVLGGFWYFFSIHRVTACWHHAYKSNQAISRGSDWFVCRQNHTLSSEELLLLSKFCHSNPPNITAFDYGIFGDAVQSGILKKTSFLKKFVRCFWWGLRNVSSYGQNLQTSSNEWETCFAVCISITALLLFIYLIGNLQMYFQMAAAKSEEAVQRMRRIEAEIDMWVHSYSLPANQKASIMQQIQSALDNNRETFDLAILRSLLVDQIQRNNSIEDGVGSMMKEEKAEQWMSRNGIPDEIKRDIMPYIRSSLQENDDVDLKTMLSILPRKHNMSLKRHLCFSVLKKVPMLRDLDDIAMETICDYLRPVIYPENSHIIQQGEPLDVIFFITEGVAWTYKSNNCGDMSISSTAWLERGDFYGDKELLQWTLNNNNTLSNIPISTTNVKAHTKVEVLALKAADLRHLVSSTSTVGSSSSSASGTLQIKID